MSARNSNRFDLLLVGLFFATATSLAFPVQRWFADWRGNRMGARADVLAMLIGDGRKMFANHFFVKADAYFHSGYYPSIFDQTGAFQTPHVAEDAGALQGKNVGDDHEFLGGSLDWIETFGRQFFPSEHTHLDEGGPAGAAAKAKVDEAREMLPWIRVAAELDPQKVETYVVASFWLRDRMGRVDEAEKFLREGLRANPGSYQILFELGRIAEENKKDDASARNLWELGLRYWADRESSKKEPDKFLLLQLSSRLALLERRTGNFPQALHYMKIWKTAAPDANAVQAFIDELVAQHPELKSAATQ